MGSRRQKYFYEAGVLWVIGASERPVHADVYARHAFATCESALYGNMQGD
jgi:hypothetical protein